jgi:hypothetical protein
VLADPGFRISQAIGLAQHVMIPVEGVGKRPPRQAGGHQKKTERDPALTGVKG